MAQSVKHLPLNFGSGYDLMVGEFEPPVGSGAPMEQSLLGVPPYSHSLSLSLSLSLLINKHNKYLWWEMEDK